MTFGKHGCAGFDIIISGFHIARISSIDVKAIGLTRDISKLIPWGVAGFLFER